MWGSRFVGARAVGPWLGEQKPLSKNPLWGNPSPEMTYLPYLPPVVDATQMLDNVFKVLYKYGTHHLMSTEMGHLLILQSAVDPLHADTSASIFLLGGTSDIHEVLNYS